MPESSRRAEGSKPSGEPERYTGGDNSNDATENAILVDLTSDPESQNWLDEKPDNVGFFEYSVDELNEFKRSILNKIEDS